MPGDMVSRHGDDVSSKVEQTGLPVGRLSSFGFSGTIAHGLFGIGPVVNLVNASSALGRASDSRVSLLRTARARADID